LQHDGIAASSERALKLGGLPMTNHNAGPNEPAHPKAPGRSDKASSPPKKGGKKRSKRKTEVPRKAYWGVFNDLVQQVALFEYPDRPKAEKTAREWTETKKGSYFVMGVKMPVENG
jgi:hypothetical protein